MRPIIHYQGDVYQGLRAFVLSIGPFAGLIWSVLGVVFILLLVFGALYPYLYAGSAARKLPAGQGISSAFPALLLVGLFVVRLPALGFDELNVDESQWIASAATLVDDPRFYESVDGTTSGPLNVYPLLLIHYLGLGIDYATIRLVGLLLVVLPVTALLWATFRLLFGQTTARLAMLPVAIGFGVSNHRDTLAFNSEHFPTLLLALALYLSARLWMNRLSWIGLFALGIILGCVPFTKLQATPSAFVLAAGVVVLLGSSQRWWSVGWLLAGGLLPSLLLIIYLWQLDALTYFYQSYIVSNLGYAQTGSYHRGITNWWRKLTFLAPRLYGSVASTRFFFGTLPLVVAGGIWLALKRHLPPRQLGLFSFSLLWFIVTVYATLQPGNIFEHYQILAYVPAFWLAGHALSVLTGNSLPTRLPVWLGAWVCLSVLMPGLYLAIQRNAGITSLTTATPPLFHPAVVRAIKAVSQPNDKMIVWGWYNRLHVDTGLLMGTRFIPLYYPLLPGDQQAYYLNVLRHDLRLNRPVVIADVSALRAEEAQQKPERYPLIWNVIRNEYQLKATLDSVRIFVRRDRSAPVATSSSSMYHRN
ncbi:hypothetical protein ACFSUS_15580 [Spirosoma soli]|uniref:Glycosyltransferase RgtA/B/C/D-like domain-containing protein n=1 Tax=Spirosoma soli TaxID=1770529 RepID=A0ABW5M536_9BACT